MEEYLVKNELKKDYDNPERTWTVYIHIVPKEFVEEDHDMYYVGITSREPHRRWKSNGGGYFTQHFGEIIKQIGWDNIQHEIVARHLTLDEAKELEKELINSLNSFGECGYNKDDGGNTWARRKEVPDLTGMTFGKWLVLRKDTEKPDHYICQCSCEDKTIRSVDRYNLESGASQSCGCVGKERIKQLKYSHGMAGTKIYNVWNDMKKKRAPKPVCDEWKNDFNSFYKWAISNGYEEGLTLNRIDKNFGFTPDNCQWITRSQKTKKTMTRKLYTYNGKTQSIPDWAKELNINQGTLRDRLGKLHMSIEDAFSLSVTGENSARQRAIKKHEYKGEYKTIREWSEVFGVEYEKLMKKMNDNKWTVEQALNKIRKDEVDKHE